MNDTKFSPRLVFTITNAGNEKKVKEAFEMSGMTMAFTCHGQGTAPSAIMDLFGLSGREKIINSGFISKNDTKLLFASLDEKLSFSQKGHGIAFTIALTGMQKKILDSINNTSEKGDDSEMNEQTPYTAILAAVAGGFSEEVVEAARSAGARGGTVIKGIREAAKDISESLGIPQLEDQEFVLILVPADTKKDVMNAITSKCGINTAAHGVVSALPLDEVYGL